MGLPGFNHLSAVTADYSSDADPDQLLDPVLMTTPGKIHTFFQRNAGKGRRSGRKQQSNAKSPWHEPEMDEWDNRGQNDGEDCEDIGSSAKSKQGKRKRERIVIDNTHYKEMPMCGIEVRLPVGLKPYPSQKLMMVRIITSLNKRLNLLAESPTGSGKTLALLASSCAWIENYKKKRQKAISECPLHSRYEGGSLSIKQERRSPEISIENVKKEIADDDEFLKDFSIKPAAHQSVSECNTSLERADEKDCLCLPKIRIYYGTRTHKQIGQVVKEFSRLPYGGIITHTILASREQSCINTSARESRDISAYCKELISTGGIGCRYKDAMKGRFEKPHYLRQILEQMSSVVFDIEELVDTLSSLAAPICPYFSSTRVLTQDADIIFCPFTYLVDPIIRNSSDVHLKKSIVILDEAHNIEDICREAASFTFYEKEISDSLGDLRAKENATLKLIEQYSSRVELMDDGEKAALDASVECYTLDLERLTSLVLLMDDIYKWFRDSASRLLRHARSDDLGKLSNTVNHGYLEVDLRKFSLHPEDIRSITTEAAYKGLLSSYKEMEDSRLLDNKLSSAALVCLEKWFYFIEYFRDENKRSMYKLNVSSEKVHQYHERGSFLQGEGRKDGQAGPKNVNYSQMTGEDSDIWISSAQGVAAHSPIRSGCRTSLSLWCMSPELAFTSAFSDCHSIILASGTLCPMDTLKTELGLKFHSQMEGEQVIPPEQIFASVVPAGPSGHRLCATYRNVNEKDSPFISELALTIRTICQSVPKGVLCFFPSYRMLTLVFEYMENCSILRQIEQKKVVVKEPRRSSELPIVMEVYEDAISNPSQHGKHVDGALMFAVFRGKISEGIDFTDDLARVVISVGIPFPNAMDDLVKEKKMYNDDFCKTKGILNGDQWYVSQAYRALNQALGRCLRHKNDWGALILVDERLTAQALASGARVVSSARISTWIRDQLIVFPQFEVFKTALSDFVIRMQLKDEENKFDITDIL